MAGPVHPAPRPPPSATEINFTVTAVEPLSNPPGLSDVFVNRGSHQRDLRIVRIKLSPAISLRHRLWRGKVYHVKSAACAYVGSMSAGHSTEAVVGAGRDTPPKQMVAGDFGGGDIQHAIDVAIVEQFFIDWPPVPVA